VVQVDGSLALRQESGQAMITLLARLCAAHAAAIAHNAQLQRDNAELARQREEALAQLVSAVDAKAATQAGLLYKVQYMVALA
jgi:hypothetical protein